MADRIRVTLSGGPFDRCLIFPPSGAIEAGMAHDDQVHLYEIKGTHGSYIGPRPIEWLLDDGASHPDNRPEFNRPGEGPEWRRRR
jgi:hypothetical protein